MIIALRTLARLQKLDEPKRAAGPSASDVVDLAQRQTEVGPGTALPCSPHAGQPEGDWLNAWPFDVSCRRPSDRASALRMRTITRVDRRTSCSQIRSTRQPRCRSVRVTKRSRTLFAMSFLSQNPRLFDCSRACSSASDSDAKSSRPRRSARAPCET